MINCGCDFDHHCEDCAIIQCDCEACLTYDAFTRLKAWEQQKDAFRNIAAHMGKETCSFLSRLDYTSAGLSEVSWAEWSAIVTGIGFAEDDDEREPATVRDVLIRFSALEDDDKKVAWENISTFVHLVVADEQERLERVMMP